MSKANILLETMITGLMLLFVVGIAFPWEAEAGIPCPPGQQINTETGECYTPTGGGGGNPGGGGQNGGGSGQNSGGRLLNPLEVDTIGEFLMEIIDILLVFATPVVVFFIIYAGYLFVTAKGNESQVSEARAALTWAVIGGVVILGARTIISVIQGTVDSL